MPLKVVLVTSYTDETLASLLEQLPPAEVRVVNLLSELHSCAIDSETILLCYATGIIVPKHVLSQLSRPAYNFHPGSPDYPGRDPHHMAIYDGSAMYGATAHEIAEFVDSGKIVGVELFPVPAGCHPLKLLSLANEALLRLFRRLAPAIKSGAQLKPIGLSWSSKKSSTKSFRAARQLPALISRDELRKRLLAFDDGTKGFQLKLHEHTFELVSRAATSEQEDEAQLRRFTDLVGRLSSIGYSFVPYDTANVGRRGIIFQHLIRVSLAHAERVADEISNMGVRGAFFFSFESPHFNVFAKESVEQLKRISELGQKIGFITDELYRTTSTDSAALRKMQAVKELLSSDCLDVTLIRFGDGKVRPIPGSSSRESITDDWPFMRLRDLDALQADLPSLLEGERFVIINDDAALDAGKLVLQHARGLFEAVGGNSFRLP